MKLILVLCIFLVHLNAWANCRCKVKSHELLFKQASHILYGNISSKSYKDGFHVYLFKNIKSYKGQLENNNVIIKTMINECGTSFVPGEHYIVYINKLIENVVYMNQCHHHYKLNEETINKPVHIQLLDMLGKEKLGEIKPVEKLEPENKDTKNLFEKLEKIHDSEEKEY